MLKPWRHRQWVIPPDHDAEFVTAMEDVLEVDHRPDDRERPVVCFDGASQPLIKATRPPIPPAPGRPAASDYEYERNGAADLFMMFEPLAGRRHVKVTERRTAADDARAVRDLVDVHYPHARTIVLVQDNLNTHKPASSRRQRLDLRSSELLAQPWERRHARRLVKRLRRHASESFTFLDHAEVPFDNNHGERPIRPAVIARKNGDANGGEDGAETQAILMSVFRALKQRGHNPVSAGNRGRSRLPPDRPATALAAPSR